MLAYMHVHVYAWLTGLSDAILSYDLTRSLQTLHGFSLSASW